MKAIASLVAYTCCTMTGVAAPSSLRMMRYAYCAFSCVWFCDGRNWSQDKLIPDGTALAETCCGGSAVGTRAMLTSFPGPAPLPELLVTITLYTAKSALVAAASTVVKESVAPGVAAWSSLRAGSSGTSATTLDAEPTVRESCIFPGLRISSLSMVSDGAVHASVTAAPLRTARKSPTGLGIPSEGGRGAPGVPQPMTPIASKHTETMRGRMGQRRLAQSFKAGMKMDRE